jgi:cell pole-organizing protein PopZ
MSDQNAQEPTMEEILASIRRIISEDEPAAESQEAAPAAAAPAEEYHPAPVAAAEPEHEDVLELTEPLPEAAPALETHGDLEVHAPAPIAEPEPAPEPVRQPEPAPVLELPPEPPVRPAYTAPAPVPEADDGLVSGHAADAASSAFGHLTQSIGMPKDGRQLEDVVRELLRPLLKAWLDEHLPAIVQATVAEEVERISRRRV